MILTNAATALDTRIFASFWLFGLINNALYVVILSAASDLVGPTIPKAIVLFFDVAPSFLVKVTAPFYLYMVPYNMRILACVVLSVCGMIILSLVSSASDWSSLSLKMFGITLASISSGLGEVTFLSLTHYYKAVSLNAWSSGTGFAGIFGSFNFMVMTTWFGLSTTTTLFTFSALPFAFFAVFWKVLPVITSVNDSYLSFNHARPTSAASVEETVGFLNESNTNDPIESDIASHASSKSSKTLQAHVMATLRKIQPLVLPYMVPLSSVYFAEYLINQGISPTLLFPLEETPFAYFRDIYVTYATLYQVGVFVSRSSAPFFRVRNLYIPSVLQCANLLICILQSMYMFIPSVYLMFLLVFYEGLLGGASYVNTFMLITEEISLDQREFALGTVSISDSLGVGLASLLGMWAETSLCEYQVQHGKPWCRMK